MRTIEVRVTVKNNGRLIVDFPTDMAAGEYNAVLVVEDRLVQHIQTSLGNAQAIFRRYIPATRKLSEELIQERREEALRE
ncbi:hypothetical protein [Prochlorothrix hollandica]|uniref:Uncharacterized protein n=1 Tax=Prochlorothrix hollandica PCC 9006 = CALU 1027 TaxID=317619 RepID=A0A0M2PP93_PROHO|nr:hypothetical protein [Prochlorothrix hollandica]KKI98400.1 hypothetical protein PROH_18205 [Prochlorothrix hollandica PCC 9006 = CALU 1027]